MKKYLSDGKKDVEDALEEARPRGGKIRLVTDEMKNAMLTAVASGLTRAEASMALGVNKEWIDHRCKEDEEFEIEINKSMQSFKLYHLSNIARHAKKSWQASAWILERSFPERFNSRVAQEMAARSKPKEAPKWFGAEIEDIETVEEVKTNENGITEDKGHTEADGENTKEEAEKDQTT